MTVLPSFPMCLPHMCKRDLNLANLSCHTIEWRLEYIYDLPLNPTQVGGESMDVGLGGGGLICKGWFVRGIRVPFGSFDVNLSMSLTILKIQMNIKRQTS